MNDRRLETSVIVIGASHVFTLTTSASYSLFRVNACCIMERAVEGA
jgi:hypothetical protein